MYYAFQHILSSGYKLGSSFTEVTADRSVKPSHLLNHPSQSQPLFPCSFFLSVSLLMSPLSFTPPHNPPVCGVICLTKNSESIAGFFLFFYYFALAFSHIPLLSSPSRAPLLGLAVMAYLGRNKSS